ncbi:MAG: AMP-binding protein [Eubacteriales bacterium]|nr:AMP-binding protein [Eubacteriales bacterium]
MLEKFLEKTEFTDYEDLKSNYGVKVPEGFNFAYDVVDAWAKEEPEKNALLYCDDNGARRMYTFADISLYSKKLAGWFLSHGIKHGDRVMFMLKQRAEVWFTLIALHRIGAVCIPATYQLTPKDIIYRCNIADVKFVCVTDDDEIISFVREALPECKTVEHVAVCGDKVPADFLNMRAGIETSKPFVERADIKVTDEMLIYFSSGTTGMPKMIKHDFSYPAGHIITAKYWQQTEENKLHLTMSDSGWAKFAWGKIYGQWICGATIVAYDNEKFSAHNTLALLEEIKVTTFCAPPTIFRFLIKEDIRSYDLSSIKHCCMAGEPLNPEVYHRFGELTGLTLYEGFGQTETPVLCANFEGIDIKPGSMGKPAPDYDIDIVDCDGKPCDDGIPGYIVIKNLSKKYPVGLFKCYLKDEAANAESFRNDCYYTGDMAWRDGEGYYWFVGRNDDVIKCSGYRIGPFEVESAIMTHPSVLECAVTAVSDPIRGQVVKATIVLTRGYAASDTLKTEIQNHVKKVTAPYKYPRIVEFAESLPKTTSGKIMRKAIRANDEKSDNG